MSSELLQLSQELLNVIIDCLSGDILSLHACSLVLLKVIRLNAFPDGWKNWVHPWRHHEMEIASPEVLPLLTTSKSSSFQLHLTHGHVWDNAVGVSVADAYNYYYQSIRRCHVGRLRDDRGCLRLVSVYLNLDADLLQHFTRWFLSDKSRFDLGQVPRLTVLYTYKYTEAGTWDITEGELHAVEEFTVHLKVFPQQEGLHGYNENWLALDSISVLDQHWDEAVSRFTNEIRAALPNLHCKNVLHLNFQSFEGDDRY
ncbi:hypothetical protein IW262DRAFT_1298703 [Armillaria fumosa]|nr:hypothetical protein IW262DRAFT_1298703 [Armillaria fumosa]